MPHIDLIIARIASVTLGVLLVASFTVLYETEEGLIQNKLEEWWVVLSDAESRAVERHAAFMAAVAALGGRLFDRIFGQKLFSFRSVGVSSCFSLASLGFVCSPGLSFLLSELPDSIYYSVLTLLLVMGVAPAALEDRWHKRHRLFGTLWLVGVAILAFTCFIGMDIVNWFNVPTRFRQTATGFEFGPPPDSVEALYYLSFIVVTIASDSLFIATTRWLLRISSKLSSMRKVLGLMVGNVALASLLVVVPVLLAWGFRAVIEILRSGSIVDTITRDVGNSGPRESFLASLAASNLLDGLVACIFFILLLVLLLHRLVWPTIQRPIYALATHGIFRHRKLFLVLGVTLIGLGGIPESAVAILKKLLEAL
jgi:hypothetical protein